MAKKVIDLHDQHEPESDEIADWFQAVGKRLAEVNPRKHAWRQWHPKKSSWTSTSS